MAPAPVLLAMAILLQPGPFGDLGSYSSAGRRDPFTNPLLGLPTVAACTTGLQCYSIDLVELKGIYRTQAGAYAVVTAGGKSYLLRPGDMLADGRVLEVGDIHIRFEQTASDPLALKPVRDVTKSLVSIAVR